MHHTVSNVVLVDAYATTSAACSRDHALLLPLFREPGYE